MGWRKRVLCVATKTDGLKLLCTHGQPSLPHCLLRTGGPRGEPTLTALVGFTLFLQMSVDCLKVMQVESRGAGIKPQHVRCLAHLSVSHRPKLPGRAVPQFGTSRLHNSLQGPVHCPSALTQWRAEAFLAPALQQRAGGRP